MGRRLIEPWGVLAILSKLVSTTTIVTGLGVEAQWLMTEEVVPR